MKLFELNIDTMQVYLNIVKGDLIDTMTLLTEEAKTKYGNLDVLGYEPPEEEFPIEIDDTENRRHGITKVILQQNSFF